MSNKDKPKPVNGTTVLIHPPVKSAGRKGSRVTGGRQEDGGCVLCGVS